MPFTTHLEPAQALAVVRFSGRLDAGTILGAMQALYDAGAWQPGFSVLWDYRAVAEVILLPDDLRRIVDFGLANQHRGGPGVDVNLINRRNELHVLVSKVFVAYRRYRAGTLRHPHDATDVLAAAELLSMPLSVVENALEAAQTGRATG